MCGWWKRRPRRRMWQRRMQTRQAGARNFMFTGRSICYLFIFFMGLLVYLFNIDHMAVCWVALLTTFMPCFWHDSPYYSLLSSTIWSLPAIIPYFVPKVPEIIARFFSPRFLYCIYHEATLPQLGLWGSGSKRQPENRWPHLGLDSQHSGRR